ncbi:hypothetical protein OCF84_21195 (plasmid) [Shewanella xiamenensis]|uniref:Uncharacterized protein n=1 Tax=Shewanella xiamenensis TaxID=332186 RepID=A0ABT6UEZ4_9GAMM|nr:hypothetical protein [Shewanella xiamenensis]MDI5832608.1 hypothetical protein [Shewanella xiamenensis]WHF57775.1 hypothetical protein OCF84_21195 [Shewanella xiamenensis]
MTIIELSPEQERAALYFHKLLSNTVNSFGRSIMSNLIMDKDECFIYVKDQKNHNRTMQTERTFAMKNFLDVLINELSSEQERSRLGLTTNYDFKDLLFNLKFTEEWQEKLFGHKFQLTIIPQSQGRVLPLGITILHTEAEWQVYENQCNTAVEEVNDALVRGEARLS